MSNNSTIIRNTGGAAIQNYLWLSMNQYEILLRCASRGRLKNIPLCNTNRINRIQETDLFISDVLLPWDIAILQLTRLLLNA